MPEQEVISVGSRAHLHNLLKARYPVIWCATHEEDRVMADLTEFAKSRKHRLMYTWSITKMLRTSNDSVVMEPNDKEVPISSVERTIQYMLELHEHYITVLQDVHRYLDDHEVLRLLRDAAKELSVGPDHRALVITSPVSELPPDLDKCVTIVDYDLPSKKELTAFAQTIIDTIRSKEPNFQPKASANRVAEAGAGLTETEFCNAIALSRARTGSIDVDTILDEKKHIIRKSGILEYCEYQEGLEAVGGLDSLKQWLDRREPAFFDPRARKYGLPPPKGVLMLGIPGCGKSLVCKTLSNRWRLPLLRLDMGKVFDHLVGSSEQNIRKAVQTAEVVAPAVLWLDEIEKGLAGTKSSGQLDSGVGARVFMTLLTWMQDKTAPVFIAATANAVSDLPPELLRKGRFDEIFFVDLPSEKERTEILDLHLTKRGWDPKLYDIEALVEATDGFTGAEIEQTIIEAMFVSYEDHLLDENVSLETRHLLKAAEGIVPLATTMKSDIDALRKWAASRARMASSESAPRKKLRRRTRTRANYAADRFESEGNEE